MKTLAVIIDFCLIVLLAWGCLWVADLMAAHPFGYMAIVGGIALVLVVVGGGAALTMALWRRK